MQLILALSRYQEFENYDQMLEKYMFLQEWKMRLCRNKSGFISGDQTLDILSSASYTGCFTRTAHKYIY